jgi:hypothetical protein
MEWLPEFALSWSERKSMGDHNGVRMLKRAAAAVYSTDKFGKRGEFGELFLHIAIRQVFGSLPAISKIFYKTSSNDTVKGFDAVHVVGSPTDLELWLGEVKFYENINKAIRDVVAELATHTTTNYLKSEFAFITNKIDINWPHAEALRQLLSPNASLDCIFKRLCVPVLLTYDSPCVKSHAAITKEYQRAFEAELAQHYAAFAGSHLPNDIRIHLFLLPLHTKKTLISLLDKGLKQWQ